MRSVTVYFHGYFFIFDPNSTQSCFPLPMIYVGLIEKFRFFGTTSAATLAKCNFKKKKIIFCRGNAPGLYNERDAHTIMKAKTARRRRRCRMSQTTGTPGVPALPGTGRPETATLLFRRPASGHPFMRFRLILRTSRTQTWRRNVGVSRRSRTVFNFFFPFQSRLL